LNAQKTLNILLLTGLALCVAQVWLPAYYLTGDGPCHVYNAQVLHDIWSKKDPAFYSRFFEVAYQPNPNWLTTFMLALLLFIVNGVIAEKIFLTLYVLLYVSGFYLLLKKIGKKKSYWLLIVFFFVFTNSLSKGFYNFSFSIAFYFWAVWTWLRFLEKRTFANAVFFFFFIALTFFTHLLAFVFAVITTASLLISFALLNEDNGSKRVKPFLLKYSFVLLLLLSPFMFLMHWFTDKEGGMRIVLHHHFYRLVELAEFKYIINVTNSEVFFSAVAGVVLLALFLFALRGFRKGFRLGKYDGFVISLLLISCVYLFFPDDFMGRAILISLRTQLFVFILIACCITAMVSDERIKNAAGLILFGCFIVLSFTRTTCRLSAAEGETDYLSGTKYIKPNSVVLPLSFSPNGKDEHGNEIARRNWLFAHASQYMGTIRPLVILDNYEANTGYFPIAWKQEVNPYLKLGNGGSFEDIPPYADIEGYKRSTGVTIDYVLMWCYDSTFLQNEQFRKLYNEVNSGYNKIYASPTNRTILYEKK